METDKSSNVATDAMVAVEIIRANKEQHRITSDILAIEEPLEIRLAYGPMGYRNVSNISVTMRTPGSDAELAIGFLFTEGIISGFAEVLSVNHLFIACRENKENTILVDLNEEAIPKLPDRERSFYTTSSCGVCGKGSIEAIRTVSSAPPLALIPVKINAEILMALPEQLSAHQEVFHQTGGLHACALFDEQGKLLLVREDVGRHNALDKLIGAGLQDSCLQMDRKILLLSGRASFELIQKAVMAGITVIAAVGAPSSLAVELSVEFGITLVGFLRNNRFNIYTSPERIIFKQHEDKNKGTIYPV